MHRTPKKKGVLTALSVAAATALAARSAHGVTLSLYYGAETNYANSNNGIFVGGGLDTTGANSNLVGEPQLLAGTVTPVAPRVGAPTTINMPVGSCLSIAIDAVLTGNPNAAAGTQQVGDGYLQPSFVGLSALAFTVPSSDSKGTLLTPESLDSAPFGTINSIPAYFSTAIINNSLLGTNGGGGYNAVPTWTQPTSPGVVQPNLPGYDTAPNSLGGVGVGATPTGVSIFGANGTTWSARTSALIPTAVSQNVLEQFASKGNNSTYADATAFLDALTFKALAAGTVTLSPQVFAFETGFWTYKGNTTVNNKTTSTYAATPFGKADTIGTLPSLVINILGQNLLSHPIVSYGGVPNASYNPSLGTLSVTGGSGSFIVASTALPGTTNIGTVEARTFGDEQTYALDVLVNGTQATPGQLATLVTEINGGGSVPSSSPAVAVTMNDPVPNPFAATGTYNLYLDTIGFSDAFLGLDLTQANDSNLVGYTISRVAVVPEPMTLGLFALGGVGLMTRRHRRRV